ncbi:uncharacterized protein LOC126754635 [Bactrocera neohumeralis]|uniref:uncharacterized protein LOC126754635 n=1 Tax=Bactrocera neohumeralis TaxID=98809 RepID=UPI0021664A5F|nr:uncharacterized protein LOC126754635 [Bactrocera neohumeralis]
MESRSKTEMLTTMLKNTAPIEVIQTAGEEVIDEKDEKILHLETEIQRLNSVVRTLNRCKNEQSAEIKRLRISIKTSEFHRNNLEQKQRPGNIFQRVSHDLNSTDPIEKMLTWRFSTTTDLRIWHGTSATNSVKTTSKFMPIQKIVRLILGWITFLKEDSQNQQIC